MPALNWNHFFEDNTNYKHADSDGNGYVDENDITAIYQNYNRRSIGELFDFGLDGDEEVL